MTRKGWWPGGSVEELLRPLKVKGRVEGTGDMEIGGIKICYVDQGRAMDYVGRQ